MWRFCAAGEGLMDARVIHDTSKGPNRLLREAAGRIRHVEPKTASLATRGGRVPTPPSADNDDLRNGARTAGSAFGSTLDSHADADV